MLHVDYVNSKDIVNNDPIEKIEGIISSYARSVSCLKQIKNIYVSL